MSKRIGVGGYQYELVEGWPKVEIDGGVADVACDSHGRVYAGVRNRQPDGKPGNILGGGGHVLVLDRDGNFHLVGGGGVEIRKPDGSLIGSWGEKGSEPGQFVTGSVHGGWIDAEGSLYTAEAGFLNRLQKFARV